MHKLNMLYITLRGLAGQLGEDLKERQEGATAVEYGLLVAGIAAVIVAIVFTLGTQINTAFTTVSNRIGGTT